MFVFVHLRRIEGGIIGSGKGGCDGHHEDLIGTFEGFLEGIDGRAGRIGTVLVARQIVQHFGDIQIFIIDKTSFLRVDR